MKGSSRDLTFLVPEFEEKARTVLTDVQLKDGYTLRPFFTVRDPWTQARLWRQSRSTAEIHDAAQMLAREDAVFLREVLVSVGPQTGRWATNAMPGESWHQWGEALDAFVLVGRRAVWSRKHPGYECYAKRALEQGLTAGYYWPRSPDAVHVQLRDLKVRACYTWAQISDEMRERFKE